MSRPARRGPSRPPSPRVAHSPLPPVLAFLAALCSLCAPAARAATVPLGCVAANYTVVFNMEWSPRDDAAYPAAANPGFSQMLCASHVAGYQLWVLGDRAGEAVQTLAETGDVSEAKAALEVARSQGKVGDIVMYPPEGDEGAAASASEVSSSEAAAAAAVAGEERPLPPEGAFNISVVVDGSKGFEYLTCISALLPSPDWFVGFSTRHVCVEEEGVKRWGDNATEPEKLSALDAGTDDGEGYEALDSPVPSQPGPRAIKRLLAFADKYGTFTMQGVEGQGEPDKEEEADSSANQTEEGGSGCFPADELLHVIDHSQGVSEGVSAKGVGRGSHQLLPMHQVRLGTNAVSAAAIHRTSSPFFPVTAASSSSAPAIHLTSSSSSSVSQHVSPSTLQGPPSSSSPASPTAEPVFFMSHADTSALSQFIQIETATTTIRLSPGHYIYTTTPGSSRSPSLAAADTIRVGDHLVSGLPGGAALRVLRISTTLARGLFNPHTPSGDLVVSGVRVSCYTRAVSPRAARFLLSPLLGLPRVAAVVSAALHVWRGAFFSVAAALAPFVGGHDQYVR